MRTSIINFSVVLLLTLNASGQNDQQAIKILDKFSASALGAPSVSMKFHLVTTDQMENTNDTLTGSLILSKDKYKLDLTDNIIWFNGETSWSYLPAEKEVTITKADKSISPRPTSLSAPVASRIVRESIDENTRNAILVGKLALINPVMMFADGL